MQVEAIDRGKIRRELFCYGFDLKESDTNLWPMDCPNCPNSWPRTTHSVACGEVSVSVRWWIRFPLRDSSQRFDKLTQDGSSAGRKSRELLIAAAAAFCTYFCMYAFRKPFTAATFDGQQVFGTALKTVLVISQLAGYMLSKFIGIKVVSEALPERRAITIVGLIAVAQTALVGFAFLPLQLKFLMMFLNGLPLGMVFGLVLSFLEGRRTYRSIVCGSLCQLHRLFWSCEIGGTLLGAGCRCERIRDASGYRRDVLAAIAAIRLDTTTHAKTGSAGSSVSIRTKSNVESTAASIRKVLLAGTDLDGADLCRLNGSTNRS